MKEIKKYKNINTKDEWNNIISENYNPFKVNNKKYLLKKGLNMKEKEIVSKEKNNKNFIKLLTKICLDLKVENYEEEIIKFLVK